jgi:DNA-binding ferritin-like protein|tara:strand:+ start:145 stop:684 length:540 start_codon:yes stop_codon:yes gene_type:complete
MEHDEENNVVMLARLQAEAEVDADEDYEDDEYEKPENTEEALSVVFKDNFVAYYRSHVAHVNIVGRNFESDHALLKGIYEDLQSQIDTIGELLRTLEAYMPSSLEYVVEHSHISVEELSGTSIELLQAVYDDIEHLIECYDCLNDCAVDEGSDDIANYAQERILTLKKHCWMLRSTLED